MTLYDFVWLCMNFMTMLYCIILCDDGWLCMTKHDSVRLYMTMYNLVWIFFTFHYPVLCCVTLCDSIWLCVILYNPLLHSMTMFDSEWPCMTERLEMTVGINFINNDFFLSIWVYLALFDSVRFYLDLSLWV